MSGKTIEFYIDDSGLKTAEIYERNIKAYFGKRRVFTELRNDEIRNSIYILLNDGIENSEKRIYIGKTTNANARLRAHDQKKDWWTDFIVFTSDKFEPTHLDYLEQKLCKIAKDNAIDTTIDNKQNPQIGKNIRKIKKEQSENYFQDMIFLLKNLNIVTLITQKDININTPQKNNNLNNNNIFYIKLQTHDDSEKKAMLSVTNDGFILLKGSYLKYECCPSLKPNSSPYKNREKLIERKLVKKVNDYYQVQKDIPYNSCSLPAAVVTARPSNGRVEWKLDDGRSIADLENKVSKITV